MTGVDFATSFCSPLARSSLWYARIFSSWRPPPTPSYYSSTTPTMASYSSILSESSFS